MRLKVTLLSLLMTGLAAACATAPGNGLIVETQSGAVQGAAAEGIQVYKGIPYAEAPVGDRRWRPPVTTSSSPPDWPG